MTSFYNSLDSTPQTLSLVHLIGVHRSEMSKQMELTKEEIRAEIREKTSDLNVFVEARKLIRARVLEVSDSGSRLTPLPQWSGTDAVLGSLDLCIHSMERTLEELRGLLSRLNEETPFLRLVTDEEKN